MKSGGFSLVIIVFVVAIFPGFFTGVLYTYLSSAQLQVKAILAVSPSSDIPIIDKHRLQRNNSESTYVREIFVPTNPNGAESLPPGIIVAETDLYMSQLLGNPKEDMHKKQKYLLVFTVGLEQKEYIDSAVKKFSDDFQIMLFHYDGNASDWDQFNWSRDAIHVSVLKQAKWWYAKRFLHPDIIATYEYIFIWDEDLELTNFDGKKYIGLVKKHGLEISQPGVEYNSNMTWRMTERLKNSEVHKNAIGDWCTNPHLPPCSAFVEIMAPVFSRKAWRCVWYMMQNDLVHGWGLDFAFSRCVHPAHEKIGVVDSQWIVHRLVPSLSKQVKSENGKGPPVRTRCEYEWKQFQARLLEADRAYTAER